MTEEIIMIKVVQGKWWLQLVEEDGKQWIHDCVQYDPDLGYTKISAETVPSEILNRCYYLEDGKILHDEIKHAEFVAEQKRLQEEFESQKEG